jgi:hypothetical protein
MVLKFTKVANFASSSFKPFDRAHVIQTLHANSLDVTSLWNLGTKS